MNTPENQKRPNQIKQFLEHAFVVPQLISKYFSHIFIARDVLQLQMETKKIFVFFVDHRIHLVLMTR